MSEFMSVTSPLSCQHCTAISHEKRLNKFEKTECQIVRVSEESREVHVFNTRFPVEQNTFYKQSFSFLYQYHLTSFL